MDCCHQESCTSPPPTLDHAHSSSASLGYTSQEQCHDARMGRDTYTPSCGRATPGRKPIAAVNVQQRHLPWRIRKVTANPPWHSTSARSTLSRQRNLEFPTTMLMSTAFVTMDARFLCIAYFLVSCQAPVVARSPLKENARPRMTTRQMSRAVRVTAVLCQWPSMRRYHLGVRTSWPSSHRSRSSECTPGCPKRVTLATGCSTAMAERRQEVLLRALHPLRL